MRHNTVVIKGNRAGMSVYLDPMVPFEKLLEDVAVKFRESAKFWGSVQMTLSLEGRPLSPEQEFKIVNTITENSQIEILCLLDTNADRIHRCEKALNEKLMELSERTGQFFKGDSASGRHSGIRSEHCGNWRCGTWSQGNCKGKYYCPRRTARIGFCRGLRR